MSARIVAESRFLRRPAALICAALLAGTVNLAAAPSGGDEAKPAAADQPSLARDGRLGQIVDLEGVVMLRPVGAARFTPASRHAIVRPGDWLQTDLRGAHAAAVRFVSGSEVVLGPGTLLEFTTPDELRFSAGEIRVVAAEDRPLGVRGPAGERLNVQGSRLLRAGDDKLTTLTAEPAWLRGFTGRGQESLGSLIARVDGRNLSLSVGEHRVNVEIRDQIARTVIEETFVNHTSGPLEGTFSFPLPDDASISGFGMWIDGQLIEADVVEKQRAREIYETILRERRDPGLLEWSGGNVFQARVAPIPGGGEKRIRLSYTQVLRWRESGYAYHYALESQMLREHPLRELAIDVKIDSALTLRSVGSPTHPVRVRRTEHAASLEFAAQHYVPTRDFEVVVEADAATNEPVLIPHRRGDDGYFLLQVMPPLLKDGTSRAEAASPGGPIDLVILADTSASMDAASRRNQTQLVAALLGSLAPQDTFNLAVCDVDCHWAFASAQPAEPAKIATARRLLEERSSLGWTDLDKALGEALGRSRGTTHVVYIGDGILTTDDGDPAAFSRRLARLYQGHAGTFHAVAISSSFEPVVLKQVAALGGGSLHRISPQHRPPDVARELVQEIVEPGLKDVQIEIRGLRTARVFPEQLPNLPRGSQQIVLGRYLPEGRDQPCEVIVSGTWAGQGVRFSHKAQLKDSEEGNSFIPRLWARHYLDALLAQGSTPVIREEIIALSERFHIITPYTSLLVLETDADRARFAVQRRFEMRDGEKFFAQGRERADSALREQQMQQAGLWRVGLRRGVLRQFNTLGRNVAAFPPADFQANTIFVAPFPATVRALFSDDWATHALGRFPFGFPTGGGGGGGFFGGMGGGMGGGMSGGRSWGMGGGSFGGFDQGISSNAEDGYFESTNGSLSSIEVAESKSAGIDVDESYDRLDDQIMTTDLADMGEPLDEGPAQLDAFTDDIGGQPAELSFTVSKPRYESVFGDTSVGLPQFRPLFAGLNGSWDTGSTDSEQEGVPDSVWYDLGRTTLGGYGRNSNVYQLQGSLARNFAVLFPPLGHPPLASSSKSHWPPKAQELARGLLRKDQLQKFTAGVEVQVRIDALLPASGEVKGRTEFRGLISPDRWLVQSAGPASPTIVQWCDATQRRSWNRAFGMGRVRAVRDADLVNPPLPLEGLVQASLAEAYATHRVVKLEPQGDRHVLLVLAPWCSAWWMVGAESRIDVLIDRQRSVILRIEEREGDKITSSIRFDNFFELGDAWWAGRVEMRDALDRVTGLTIQSLRPLPAGELARRWQAELPEVKDVQWLHEPPPTLAEARRRAQDNRGTFEDQLLLLLHDLHLDRWDRVQESLQRVEQAAGDVVGMPWLRAAVLVDSRRSEEARKRIMALAADLAAAPVQADELFLAEFFLGLADHVFESHEQLALLDVLRGLYERQPPMARGPRHWIERRINSLNVDATTADQDVEVLRLRRELAEQYPREAELQYEYARRLGLAGDYEAAYAWLARVERDPLWTVQEQAALRTTHAGLLRDQGRRADLVDYLAGWLRREPANEGVHREYLAALTLAGHFDQANQTAAEWLGEAQRPTPRKPEAEARLAAALSWCLRGADYPHVVAEIVDPRWLVPLSEAALAFISREDDLRHLQEIVDDHHFRRTDQGRRLAQRIERLLRDEIDRLSLRQIKLFVQSRSYYDWPDANDSANRQAWRPILAGIRRRQQATADAEIKHEIGLILVNLLSQSANRDDASAELLDVLRLQVRQGPVEYRAADLGQLFATLVEQPWSAANESEALGLIAELSADESETTRQVVQVGALQRLTDRMVAGRAESQLRAARGNQDLTRTQWLAKRTEIHRAARAAFSDRLGEVLAKPADPLATGPLLPWIKIERAYLDLSAGRDPTAAIATCWSLLPADPAELAKQPGHSWLERTLNRRALATLAQLTTRPGTKAEAVDRLLNYIDRAAAADVENPLWKQWKVQLLVALDRPQALEESLRAWVKADDLESRWRQLLGYLAAEQGRLDEAIKLFERMRDNDELNAADWRALANWLLATSHGDESARARQAAFDAIPEENLQQWVWHKISWQGHSWRVQQSPSSIQPDEDVVTGILVLLKKSDYPQNVIQLPLQYYQATRDERLLSRLADAVVGHTAQTIYPLLEELRPVLKEIRSEAVTDLLREHLTALARSASSDVDRRALDLLEALVERSASEVLDQPGQHVERSLAAFQRAYRGTWAAGEPRSMADLLASLGRITAPRLAEEQLRELAELHRQSASESDDRLRLAAQLAKGYAHYDRWDEAIDVLAGELGQQQADRQGRLRFAAQEPLAALVSYCGKRGQHARAEKLLLDQLGKPSNRPWRAWLEQRLCDAYVEALKADGEVSLGRGENLYLAAQDQTLALLASVADQQAEAALKTLLELYRAAHAHHLARVARDMRTRALPALLAMHQRRQPNANQSLLEAAQLLHDVAGPHEALALVVDFIEQEPAWLQTSNRRSWNQICWQMSLWRTTGCKPGDALEDRLLKIVTRELRISLEYREYHHFALCSHRQGHYWQAKEDVFVAVAEDVARNHADSQQVLVAVADYLYHDVQRPALAIDLLLAAHRRLLLQDKAQTTLAEYLHGQSRWADSIPILEPLVTRRPGELGNAVLLLRAYFHAKAADKLLAQRQQTDEFFHQDQRWTEVVATTLGDICLETELFELSAAYLREAIALGMRGSHAPGDRQGHEALSHRYRSLARALAGLGKTPEAVEAASAAIVVWGHEDYRRQEALDTLAAVLGQAKDLDAYLKQLDRETSETGLDRPIVRRAIGHVFSERGAAAKAIAQYKLALEAQPFDQQTQQELVACYDQAQDPPGAIGQLLQLLEYSRRNLDACEDLGQRFLGAQRPDEALRAITSLVDLLPDDAESHRRLAGQFQALDRWTEACVQWRQVARIRALEPAGLLGLAEAQIHLRQWNAATETLRTLESHPWPQNSGDVPGQVAHLRSQLPVATEDK